MPKSQFLNVIEANSSELTSGQKKVLTNLSQHLSKKKVTTRQMSSCLKKAMAPKKARKPSEWALFVKEYSNKNPNQKNLLKNAAKAWRAKKGEGEENQG